MTKQIIVMQDQDEHTHWVFYQLNESNGLLWNPVTDIINGTDNLQVKQLLIDAYKKNNPLSHGLSTDTNALLCTFLTNGNQVELMKVVCVELLCWDGVGVVNCDTTAKQLVQQLTYGPQNSFSNGGQSTRNSAHRGSDSAVAMFAQVKSAPRARDGQSSEQQQCTAKLTLS